MAINVQLKALNTSVSSAYLNINIWNMLKQVMKHLSSAINSKPVDLEDKIQ